MRPELLTPRKVTTKIMHDMLTVIGEDVSTERIERWAPLEAAVVYDWACREYLRASDNSVRARPRPFLMRVPNNA
jgi:hypothetical protein